MEAVLEYIQGMMVVKSYGLEKDNDQTVNHAVQDSCKKARALEKSVAPWMALRQIVVRVFGVAIAAGALIFYFHGSLTLPLSAHAHRFLYDLRAAGKCGQHVR